MHELVIDKICAMKLGKQPDNIKRLETGLANYVYKICFDDDKYIIRLNDDKNAYKNTIYWLDKLKGLDIPIPRVIHTGDCDNFSFIILNFIEGEDLGYV
jgi:fructosamine-3-kinase